MNIDKLTAKYIELRDRRSALKRAFEEDDDKLKTLMTAIEDRLRENLTALGVESMRTEHGTVFKTYKEFANVGNWDEVLDFIRKHEAWDMLERRVSKSAVTDRMQQTPDGSYLNPPPPGVNFARIETVQIRRR